VIFGTPLAEYLPETLISGRVGLVGDAAHVASPMVGAGFASGLEDGTAFIAAVSRSGVPVHRRAFRPCVATMSCGWHPTAAECSRASPKHELSCVRSKPAKRSLGQPRRMLALSVTGLPVA
jgi:FAD binding domain